MRTDKKESHNVGQRTSALCCHGSPLMARSFSNTDAFYRFNGVRDRDVFFLCWAAVNEHDIEEQFEIYS